MLQHLAARRQQRRPRSNHLSQRDQVVFIPSGAMQDQERPRALSRSALEAVNEGKAAHYAALSISSIGGSAASISRRRDSRNAGSLSSRPRRSTGSSTAKPGWSVAISNRIPPGSRKYTERK